MGFGALFLRARKPCGLKALPLPLQFTFQSRLTVKMSICLMLGAIKRHSIERLVLTFYLE